MVKVVHKGNVIHTHFIYTDTDESARELGMRKYNALKIHSCEQRPLIEAP